jgi:hypothetical protein
VAIIRRRKKSGGPGFVARQPWGIIGLVKCSPGAKGHVNDCGWRS